MKTNFLKISKVIVCASLLSTYSVKPAVDISSLSSYTRAVHCAENAGKHMKNLAKWNYEFLHSSKTYKQLLADFGQCAKWFQDNVASKLLPIKRGVPIEEHDIVIKEMHIIIDYIKEMMVTMCQMLKELEKE